MKNTYSIEKCYLTTIGKVDSGRTDDYKWTIPIQDKEWDTIAAVIEACLRAVEDEENISRRSDRFVINREEANCTVIGDGKLKITFDYNDCFYGNLYIEVVKRTTSAVTEAELVGAVAVG